jgi:hypothetical protein
METAPLGLFEAVFKVVEERVPFGRALVTITSGLMLASLIVFCVEYLVGAFAVAVDWIVLSLKAKSFVPLPRSSTGVFFPWWLIAIIWVSSAVSFYQLLTTLKNLQKLGDDLERLDQRLDQLRNRP